MADHSLTVARSALLEALQRVTVVAGRTGEILIGSGVLAECSAAGLRLTCTDFDQTISTTIPAEVDGSDFRFCVGAKALLAIVAQLPPAPVTIAAHGRGKNGGVRVTAGRAVFDIGALNAAEFPLHPESPAGGSFDLAASAFVEALKRAAPHALAEGSGVLRGVCVRLSDDGVDVAATDRHVGYRERLKADTSARGTWVVPTPTVTSLARIFAKSESIAISGDETRMTFSDGMTVLHTRLIEGQYPDLDRMYSIARERETLTVTADRIAFTAAVKRAATLPGQIINVRLTPGEGELAVVVRNEDGGSGEDAIPCATTGKPFAICYNPRLLLLCLDSLEGSEVRVGFGTPDSPALLTEPGKESAFTGALIMPMRDRAPDPMKKPAKGART